MSNFDNGGMIVADLGNLVYRKPLCILGIGVRSEQELRRISQCKISDRYHPESRITMDIITKSIELLQIVYLDTRFFFQLSAHSIG